MSKSFYITTPIYYPNAAPHVGTAYTTIICDVVARYKRLTGEEVGFMTGVDEHGQKIQEAAEKNGFTPQQWVDKMSLNFTTLWKKLNILFLFFSLVAIMSIYFLIDDFIKLWLGEKFIFSKLTTILILINFFIYFSRMITDIFKDGDGFFEDTNLPILEAIINFLISLILVNLIGINGVIIGTIVSNILIICIARPILVFKRCFNKGTNKYIKLYRQYLFFIMVTILISCLIINNTPIFIVKTWLDFILKAAVVGGINFVLILIIFLKNSDFRKNYKLLVLE